jgi:hypothetical protein
MRVEEFKRKTDEELLRLADECFVLMETRGVEQEPAHLLKAQFYMNEVGRRHDATIARRDFVLELIIIALILAEIVFGIVEGNKQAAILDHMNNSTSATATATQGVNTSSQDQATRLKALADEQTKSLDSLREMNKTLQSSVRQSNDMVAAMQEQLTILKEDQANRQAQLAKKPKLELGIGSVPLDTFFKVSFKEREQTDTTITFDFTLRNLGDATATKGSVRAIVTAKDVSLQCNCRSELVSEAPDSPTHTFLVPFDYLRPRVRVFLPITFTYPKGQQPFDVIFNVDADELPTATPLGSIRITPRRPSN